MDGLPVYYSIVNPASIIRPCVRSCRCLPPAPVVLPCSCAEMCKTGKNCGLVGPPRQHAPSAPSSQGCCTGCALSAAHALELVIAASSQLDPIEEALHGGEGEGAAWQGGEGAAWGREGWGKTGKEKEVYASVSPCSGLTDLDVVREPQSW